MTVPASQVLDAQNSVVLDGTGAGILIFSPEAFRTWVVTTINVRTDQAPTVTPVPQVTVWLGQVNGLMVAQSWMGNRATAGGSPVTVQPSQPLVVQWANGVPGSRASAFLYGTMSMR